MTEKLVSEMTTQQYAYSRSCCTGCCMMQRNKPDGGCIIGWCANIKVIERHTFEINFELDERFIEIGSLF